MKTSLFSRRLLWPLCKLTNQLLAVTIMALYGNCDKEVYHGGNRRRICAPQLNFELVSENVQSYLFSDEQKKTVM